MLKRIGQFWLPSEDTHLSKMRNFVTKGEYQTKTLLEALKRVKSFGVGFDIGANIGVMSYWMSKHFKAVYAFEPNDFVWRCLEKNTHKLSNVQIHKIGLSDVHGRSWMQVNKRHCGLGTIGPRTEHSIEIRLTRIDALPIAPDFIKIDVEGHEDEVIRGGLLTLQAYKPVILLEEVAGKTSCRKMLETIGYKVIKTIRNDHILEFQ